MEKYIEICPSCEMFIGDKGECRAFCSKGHAYDTFLTECYYYKPKK